MELIVNGVARTLEEGASLADLVRELGLPDRGVAIAVDDAVIPRGGWSDCVLQAQRRVEVLTAVQGG